MLDRHKPLRRLQKIRNKRGETCWVELKYERLPFFCYICGVMGHIERDCQEEEVEGDEKGRQWGAWLKASPRKGIASNEEEILQLFKSKKTRIFHTKQHGKSGEEKGSNGGEGRYGGSNSGGSQREEDE
ncbi:Gag-Pro-Pol polyprotein [Bienertia sinuspersici]